MELNPFQERAVTAPGHCTILACPGSGKTRVLSERAAYLLNNQSLGRLCAVTFTNHSAIDLKRRVLSACGQDKTSRLAVGTFHSVALNQLKRNLRKEQMPRLLSDGESMAVLRRCIRQHAPKYDFDGVVAAIQGAKAKMDEPDFDDVKTQAVYEEYQRVLASEGAMDFADILLLAVQKMQGGQIAPLPIQWLLVDEAQDMDAVQMEWILSHARNGVLVTLVGDDDQSLYAFRHALGYDGIREVAFALAATEVTLPINYRCAANILNHAAKLIGNNQNRAPKKITAERTDNGVAVKIRASDRTDEMAKLVDAIRNHDNGKGWAVLARTNTILDDVELALLNAGIPFLRTGGKSVWEGMVGSTFVGLLRTILDGSWTGISNALSFCGVPAGQVNGHSHNTNGDCFSRLQTALASLEEGSAGRKTLQRLSGGLGAWMTLRDKNRAALIVYGVSDFLADYCKQNQYELLKRLESTLANMNGTLQQRLLLIARESKVEASSRTVEIMTMHASKGLEFDNVWITGAEEGNLPHTDSTEEDERRVMYVGMTRARHRLFVSSSAEEGLESRFIEEAALPAT